MLKKMPLSIVMSLLFFACQDEKAIEDTPLDSQITLDDPVAYTEFHFNQLGTEIAKLASNQDFRNLVYLEIDKKFDGDDNVLLETLSSTLVSLNSRVSGTLSNNESFQTSLEAFKNIEGENYYPQIYIPFYEELKKVSQSNGRIMSVESEPLFVFYTGDETQEIVPSYQLDENSGEFIETGIMVDEEYALSHEVWVISINERIEGDQVIFYDKANVADDSKSARTNATLKARITRVDIKCRKESWLAGKHEIRMRAESTWFGAKNPSTGNVEFINQIGSDFLGDDMAKVKIRKRDLRRGRWKRVNMDYRYGSKWDTNDGQYLIYTIFEKDNWPAKVRYAAGVRVPGASIQEERSVGFRSSDSEWITDYISSGQAGNYYAENGCIKVYTGWY